MPDPLIPVPFPQEQETANISALGKLNAAAKPVELAPQPSAVLDVVTQAFVGPAAAATEAVGSVVNPLFRLLTGWGGDMSYWTPDGVVKTSGPISSGGFVRPETTAGGITRGLTQGITGYALAALGPGKFIKAGALLKGAIVGGVADYAAFGANEERLSNVLAPMGIPGVSAVADYLKATPDDTEAEGKLKNVIEGALVGAAVTPFIEMFSAGLRMIRSAKTATTKAAAKEAVDLGTSQVEDALHAAGVAPKSTKSAEARVASAEVKDRVAAADPKLAEKPDDLSAVAATYEAVAKYINPDAPAHETLDRVVSVRNAEPAVAEAVPVADTGRRFQLDEPAVPPAAKGMTDWAEDGKAVVKLYGSADASTHLHEMAHVVSRHLREDDKATIENWLGIEPGTKWSEAHDEQFARAFEKHIVDGVSPTVEMAGPMERLSALLKDIYKKITGSSIDINISPEVRKVYDKLLGATDKTIAEKAAVDQSVGNLRDLGVDLKHTEARALAERIGSGKQLDKEALDHLTPKLMAAREAGSLEAITREFTILANKLHPTGVETLKITKRLADQFGKSQEEVKAWAEKFVGENQSLAAKVAAFDITVQSVAHNVNKLAKAAASESASLAELADFVKGAHQLEELVSLQYHGQSILGRAVGAYRLRGADVLEQGLIDKVKSAPKAESDLVKKPTDPKAQAKHDKELGKPTTGAGEKILTKPVSESASEVEAYVAAAGGEKRVREIAEKMAKAPAAPLVDAAKQASYMTTKLNKVLEYWINQILSGPLTHMVNSFGNALNTMALPIQRIIGGKLIGDAAQVRMGISQLTGLRLAMGESMRAGVDSFRNGGHDVLDTVVPHELAMQRQAGQIKSPFVRKYLLWAGRALQAEDTFFKHMNFRATAYADLMERSLDLHHSARQEYIESNLKKLWEDPTAYANGVNMARLATFQESLKGTGYEGIQQLVNKYPVFKLVIPFVKTPANIIRQMGHYVPGLPMMFEQTRDALRGRSGATTQAVLVGRQVMGLGFITAVGGLWSAGVLTGSGPADKQQRDAWVAAGNRPYSIKVGQTWVSYQRLAPFANLFGLAADTLEAGKAWKNPSVAGSILFAGLQKNITDQTFFAGIANLTDVIEQRKDLGRYLSDLGGSMLPQSSAFRQITKSVTGTLYQTESMVDQFKQRALGMWNGHPKRDINGDPVNIGHEEGLSFIPMTAALNDQALNELANIPGGISLEPSPSYRGVTLSTDQKDRVWERMGKILVGGKTLHQALEEVVQSAAYKKLPPLSELPRGAKPDDIPQKRLLEVRIQTFESAAKAEVLKQTPTLSAALTRTRDNRKAMRSGDWDAVQEVINQ